MSCEEDTTVELKRTFCRASSSVRVEICERRPCSASSKLPCARNERQYSEEESEETTHVMLQNMLLLEELVLLLDEL